MNSDKNKDMNKEDINKKENRKALKIFIPVIIAAALAGGIIGGFSTTSAALELAEKTELILGEAMYLSSPYITMAVIVIGMLTGFICCKKGIKAFEESSSEKNELRQEALYNGANCCLSRGIMTITVSEILALTFFSVTTAYIDRYIENNSLLPFFTIAVFCIGGFVRIKIQQLIIDTEKTMNPAKRGSVYDLNFQKKWEESCDEMEKMIIYKASYKAYKTAMISCAAAFLTLMILSFVFSFGPLPCVVMGVLWLIIVISYYREAMRLGKEKINL